MNNNARIKMDDVNLEALTPQQIGKLIGKVSQVLARQSSEHDRRLISGSAANVWASMAMTLRNCGEKLEQTVEHEYEIRQPGQNGCARCGKSSLDGIHI